MAPFSLSGSLIVFSMSSLMSAAIIQPGRWLQTPLVLCLQGHCHSASICPLLDTDLSHLVSCESVGRGEAESPWTLVCFYPSYSAKSACLEAYGLPMHPSAGDGWEQQHCLGKGCPGAVMGQGVAVLITTLATPAVSLELAPCSLVVSGISLGDWQILFLIISSAHGF